MRLLVVGANGLLGSNVVAEGLDRNWDLRGTYHSAEPDFEIPLHQLDITNTDHLDEVIGTVDPDWVVNCAAMTDVDGCEEMPEQAYEVNGEAPSEMASLCAAGSIGFLHVSTDYVFDGNQQASYSEDGELNPIQEYGASKLQGERAVRSTNENALITRLSFVYGIHRSSGSLTGFPAWVRERLAEGEETPLFTDQHVTPTRAGQAATTFLDLIEKWHSGTFHVAVRSCVTPHKFGRVICHQMDADESLLIEGSQADIERAAQRPANTCLDVTRLEEALGRKQPTLDADLDAISEAFDSGENEA